MRLVRVWLVVVACALGACTGGAGVAGGGEPGNPGQGDGADGDPAPRDGTSVGPDAAPTADGGVDAGSAGGRDGGGSDAGQARDAGADGATGVDASAAERDGGSTRGDAGPRDGGPSPDGGGPDGGALDGGSTLDAGALDAGAAVDAGGGNASDAGVDAGVDAGTPDPNCVDPFVSNGHLVTGLRIAINEVVAFPRADWSQSSAGGVGRFTSPAGTGKVDATDQFVELYNGGTRTVDLRNWLLTVKDETPATTKLGFTSGSYFVVSSGSSLAAFKPGGYVVIGNPAGVAATDAYYTLLTPCGALVDDVEVGGTTNPEGDATNDGAPATGQNGRAHGAFDEGVARYPNGVDTGNDVADFAAMWATPLAANTTRPIDTSDHVAPTLLTRPSGSSVSTMLPLAIGYDEQLDAPLARAGFVARTVSTVFTLGAPDFSDDDHTIVLNPVGRFPFNTSVLVYIDGVPDRNGNYAATGNFSFRTEARPASPGDVLINEVVCTPRQDFSADGFAGTPGGATPDEGDQYLELHNLRPGLTDLSGYALGFFQGPNDVTNVRTTFTLGEAANLGAVVRVVGSGTLTALAQGDYVVIGNPPDQLLPDTSLELRNASGALVDLVEIGGTTAPTDRGGNGANNGAPGPNATGASTGLTDESVSRIADADSGDDALDFCYARATPGAENGVCTLL